MGNNDCSVESVNNIVKSLDNFLYGIANNVSCTICQELLKEAVTYQCGHSFCSECIKKFLATTTFGRVNCPLCRNPVKRRSGINNPVLTKIAEICSKAPAAFKEDVMNLNLRFKDIGGEELVKSSRISGICEEKVKDDRKNKNESKKIDEKDSQQITSNVSVILCSVASTNEENTELKSISQLELKSQSFVGDSPYADKKLRNVKKIRNKEKVSNWLHNVNSSVISTPESGNDAGEKLSGDRNESGVASPSTSMIRIDYVKSKRSNALCSDKTLTLGKDNDPYEFIPSQRNTPPKRKRASRGRKRAVPEFEAIQSFGKEKLKKGNPEDRCVDPGWVNGNAAAADDDDSSVCKVQVPFRTYSTRSSRKNIMDDSSESIVGMGKIRTRGRPKKVLSESENSSVVDIAESDSVISVEKDKPSDKSVKPILPSSPATDDDFESLKKRKVDDLDKSESFRSGGSSKCSQSPGWSRVSNLKVDFETADKRNRPCRKTLNISGGEITGNTPKVKTTPEIPSESDKKIHISNEDDMYIEDLSQKSDSVVGFDSQQSKKEDFTVVVEKIEKELEGFEKLCGDVHVGSEEESKIAEKDVKTAKDETIRKTPNRKPIPFALLGKIKKKKRKSIVFVKMGKLSRYLTKSGTTVVKLVLPAVKEQKRSVAVQADTEMVEESVEAKIDIGVQTTQDVKITRGIQTTQRNDSKDVTVQTADVVPSQMFQEFNTSREAVRSQGQNMDIDLDTELECELNKTWATTQGEKVENKQEEPTRRNVNEDEELTQLVTYDINVESIPLQSGNPTEQSEEYDSDIFIDQTPPKEMSRANEKRGTELVGESTEESFLILSECQSEVPVINKPKTDTVRLAENDENNQNELNRKSQGLNRKLCIVSSGILNRKLIEKFVERFHVDHSNFPKKDMTHLVVGLHENDDDEFVPFCTPKFLYAIANKKWIVTETWVEKCLVANAIVAEEPYESVDPVGGNGCRIARLSTRLLMENCEIYMLGKFLNITKEEFSELIHDCGGRIVSHCKDFSNSQSKIRMILVDGSEIQENKEYEAIAKTYRTLVMSRDVAIMSIQSYQMVNFTAFILHSFSTEECVKWGYPVHLVKREASLENSFSDSEAQR